MKKKICITGASGFIGSALTEWLRKEYKIIAIDRVPYEFHRSVKFYCQDINSTLPNLKDVYAVIHLAARPGVRNSRELFREVCNDNILGTQRILDKCVTNWKPKILLISSSSSVYGDNGQDGHALKEEEIVSPRSLYACSKVANEQMMITYKNCGLLDDISCAALRYFTCFGPNQRNELAIRAFTDWMIKGESITLYGTGNQFRDFTYIDDICSGIESFLSDNMFMNAEIFNIGSGNSHSINEIIHMIATYLNKNVTINYQPRNRYDVDRTLADISKIRYWTGWRPKIKFKDGLEQQIDWQKRQHGI